MKNPKKLILTAVMSAGLVAGGVCGRGASSKRRDQLPDELSLFVLRN